jgi:hypothetical protein
MPTEAHPTSKLAGTSIGAMRLREDGWHQVLDLGHPPEPRYIPVNIFID